MSLVGAGYLALMCWFSYLVIFYDFTATNKFLFCLTLCAVSFAALSAMLYSRFQILTRLTSILLLPAILPQILLCFGQWELILPIAVTSLIIFFLSGAGETVKTVFGVIYLLLYVLGSLAFFMLMSFFTPSTQQTILENGESPSGAYRYEIIQTDDSSGGNVAVHIEPNDRDIHLPFLTFVSNGYDRTVYEERPIPSEVGSAQWSTVSRRGYHGTAAGNLRGCDTGSQQVAESHHRHPVRHRDGLPERLERFPTGTARRAGRKRCADLCGQDLFSLVYCCTGRLFRKR